MSELFEELTRISKAHAYDILADQVKELQSEKNSLKIVLKTLLHAVEHEGVIHGRVTQAVDDAKSILKILKP